jgi:hypothetical protein
MNLNKLTKKELVDYAESQGISLNVKDKKEVLVSKLKALDNRKKIKNKKEPWWISLGVLIIIIGAIKYIWFPTLVFFKVQILMVALAIAFLVIGSWIESKISSDPDSNWTLIIGGIIVVCYIIWGISWGVTHPYG